MKNNKQKKVTKVAYQDDNETLKAKKKARNDGSKINVKSKKFWEEIYDNEGEEIEKFIR
ncbi:MAG: hypothetical protein IPN86_13120 [Saprospiraceae bacterium]|nr:hypothetical protein [Saprospiraceae bacterium]